MAKKLRHIIGAPVRYVGGSEDTGRVSSIKRKGYSTKMIGDGPRATIVYDGGRVDDLECLDAPIFPSPRKQRFGREARAANIFEGEDDALGKLVESRFDAILKRKSPSIDLDTPEITIESEDGPITLPRLDASPSIEVLIEEEVIEAPRLPMPSEIEEIPLSMRAAETAKHLRMSNYTLLARAPAPGVIIHDQDNESPFVYDKILVNKVGPNPRFEFFAAPSVRDKNSLDRIMESLARVGIPSDRIRREEYPHYETRIIAAVHDERSPEPLFMMEEQVDYFYTNERIYIKTLPESGTGDLYLVYNLKHKRLEVLKAAKRGITQYSIAKAQLDTEAQMLLDSDYFKGESPIVQAYDYVELDDGTGDVRKFIVMEYCNQTTMHLGQSSFRKYTREVRQAVKEAEEAARVKAEKGSKAYLDKMVAEELAMIKREAEESAERTSLGSHKQMFIDSALKKALPELQKAAKEHDDARIEDIVISAGIKKGSQPGHQLSDKMTSFAYLVLQGIAEVLHTLDKIGVIDRDIKPGNLLWKLREGATDDLDVLVKAIDKGTALTYKTARRNPTPSFTPSMTEPEAWLARIYAEQVMEMPELARNDDEPDADMYSAGRCLLDVIGEMLGVDVMEDLEHDYHLLFFRGEYEGKLYKGHGLDTIPKMLQWNREEIVALRKRNDELNQIFDPYVFNIIEELTSVRTCRPRIDELVIIKVENKKTGEVYRHCDVEPVNEPVIDSGRQYTVCVNPGNPNMTDVNLGLALGLGSVVHHLKETHKNGNIYLKMDYDPLSGNVSFSQRVSLRDAKRLHPSLIGMDYANDEPETWIPYFGALAVSHYTDDRELARIIREDGPRMDREEEDNHYHLGRLISRVMANVLGVETFERTSEVDHYLRGYVEQLEANGVTEWVKEQEPVSYFNKAHQWEIYQIEQANNKRKLFDHRYVTLARDLTRWRMKGRIDLDDTSKVLQEILHACSPREDNRKPVEARFLPKAKAPKKRGGNGSAAKPLFADYRPVDPTDPTQVYQTSMVQVGKKKSET